jgi:hypothetical protein
MPRITPRFLPRLRLLQPATPAQGALYRDYMVDQLRDAGYLPPSSSQGMRFIYLNKDDVLDFDGMPGMPGKIHSSALCSQYKVVWIPTQAKDYTRIPSPEEKAWRDLDKAQHQARLEDIEEQLKDATGDNKTELETERNAVQSILDQLNAGGYGYLRTSWNAMKTKVSGIFWGLAAPNVPVKLRLNRPLDKDRSLSFAYKRFALAPEQARDRYIIGFGNGFTQYALSIANDGNSAEFWHYRNMSAGARAKLEAQLETLLDFGRLTIADQKQILNWEIEERGIRAAANAREKGKKKLTDAESARIEALQKLASDLRDSKHLTEEQEQAKQKLEDKIFLAREAFRLQEESTDLIGKRVDVTVQFLRCGMVVVRSGKSEFIYENKRVTGLEPPQFHTALPAKSYLTIDSAGGKWGFIFGAPEWESKSTILTAPFESFEVLHKEDFTSLLVGDLLDNSKTENGKVWNYGCSAQVTIEQLRAPKTTGPIPQPGKYQVKIEFTSDGRYTPELYYFGLHRPASTVGAATSVWYSEDTANLKDGMNRLKDIVLQDDKRRTRLANAVITNGLNAANLPAMCGGLACDVELLDRETMQTIILLKHGFVMRDERGRCGTIETASGFVRVPLVGSETVLDVTGCEQFLNRKITAPVPSDGMFPNDYVRLCCRDAGLPESLYSRIPSGDAGYPHIPPTRPGQYPHGKPSQGCTYLAAISDTVTNHMKGAQFWSDDLGLRIDKFAVRDQPAKTYGTPTSGVAADSRLCLRGEFKLSQDLRDYVTSAIVIGAKDPKTGQRYSAREEIPQCFDEQFKGSPYYVGYDLPLFTSADDSLQSEAACKLAARDALHLTPQTPDGLAPQFGDIHIDYDPSLKTGDMVRIFNVKYVVDTIEFGALSNDEGGQTMSANVQLAQDITPVISP